MAKTLADMLREARGRIRELTIDDFDELVENHEDLLLVDVREADEYARGHLPGALLVPRGTLEGAADRAYRTHLPRLDEARERNVVLYCQNGARSALAADTLQQMGFTRVYHLAGGCELWEAEGRPLVRD